MSDSEEHLLFRQSIPICAAHAGGGYLLPPNTMEAFQFSVYELKMPILEFDIRKTKDGHLICLHDPLLDHQTNGFGLVSDASLKKIQSLDAGFKFSPDKGKSFPWRNKGLKVPLLKQVLEEFVPIENLILYFDMKKQSVVESVIELVRFYKLEKRAILGAVLPNVNKKILSLKSPEMICSADYNTMGQIMTTWSSSKKIYKCPQLIVGFWVTQIIDWGINKKFLGELKANGKKIAVFGPGTADFKTIKKYVDMGIDMVFSDRPDQVLFTKCTIDKSYPSPEQCPKSVMEWAALKGYYSIVVWLQTRGRPKNQKENQCTVSAMDFAASQGYLEIVKYLYQHANQVCSERGLKWAKENNQEQVVKWLERNSLSPKKQIKS